MPKGVPQAPGGSVVSDGLRGESGRPHQACTAGSARDRARGLAIVDLMNRVRRDSKRVFLDNEGLVVFVYDGGWAPVRGHPQLSVAVGRQADK